MLTNNQKTKPNPKIMNIVQIINTQFKPKIWLVDGIISPIHISYLGKSQ